MLPDRHSDSMVVRGLQRVDQQDNRLEPHEGQDVLLVPHQVLLLLLMAQLLYLVSLCKVPNV